MSQPEDDGSRRSFLVDELEQAADWRIRKAGEDPQDGQSAAAAIVLQRLADDVRTLIGAPAYRELMAICGWLDEGGGAEEFADRAHAYRIGIGAESQPGDGEAYLRHLLLLAKQSIGS